MKRVLLTGLAVVAIAAALPVTASATDTPTVPTQCVFSRPLPPGPARVVHGSHADSVRIVETPNCEDVDGICVYITLTGPSRTVHGHSISKAPAPCVPIDPNCNIEANAGAGAQRTVHQPSAVQVPRAPEWIVSIPEACQEAMVLALTPTGSDTAPTIWIATALIGTGAVLIMAPRRLARR
mgnify:CR=1 FL=1